ncbi:MAG: hypothetical protein QME96_09580 [Myxococcota bacterium]|nr:hypothetical protein [Myxococcota bacterium]
MPAGCPAAPDDPAAARELAGEFFSRAAERDNAGAHAEAVALYSCCYAIVPHPNTLFNLALAAERAGDLATAEAALSRYVEDAPEALNRSEAEALLGVLRERIAALSPEERTGVEEPVAVGGSAGGEESPAGGVESPAGGVESAAGTGALEIAGWVLLGAGVAIGGAGGTTFAVLAAGESEWAETNDPGTPWSEAVKHQDKYDTYTALEIAMLAVGGAALAVGAAILAVALVGEEEGEPPVTLAPAATGDAAGVTLRWRF